MLRRDFYSYDDFRVMAGADDESIRQTLMRGDLRAYLEPKNELARLMWKSFVGGVAPSTGANNHCSWQAVRLDLESSVSDYYRLSGWFRVEDESLKNAARQGRFESPPEVIPPLGDGDLSDGDVYEFSYEVDRDIYNLSPIRGIDSDYHPQLKSLWFHVDDVLRMTGVSPTAWERPGNSKQPKLRSDAEENYLRVIAALWALSDLDRKPNTAAKTLLDEIGLWDWDKPGHDTIAKTLTQAAGLAKGKHPKFG